MGNTIAGVLRRNFHLIVKPITLTILFFALVVWLYFAYSSAILESAPLKLKVPTLVAEESARLSSLGSFLSALFQGNLGYSFFAKAPVWSVLLGRLGITVLLIVLSTVISIATGVIFAFIALKLGPRSHKPLTFAHSQKGFFFGLTLMTALVLIVLFSYHLKWFPSSHTIPDYWAYYPPENIFVEIAGRLRHLALPAFTLTIIFMVRSFFIVWSGGSPFISKKTLKRLLLPFTTTDFACIISAVVLIEHTFILPGVGYVLLQSIETIDLTMTVGAFIVLLAIAVILGYVSVLLDFIQQHFGLREDLKKKVAPKSGIKEIFPQSSKHTLLRRVARQVLERKSLVTGSVIVIFFLAIAAFAPLITPYDQHGRDIFTQVLYGARTMLIATVPTAAVAALIGLGLGFLAGYFQNWVDNLVMVLVDTTLATPVLPLLMVFHLIYWYPRITWFLILLWPLCALATMASRKVYMLRPKNQKLSGNNLRSRFLNLFKDFSANFCLLMVSVVLLNLIISTRLIGFYEPMADWGSILYSALYTPKAIEFWWQWVLPIACTILFAAGFLLIGIGLDEHLQPFKRD